VKLLLDTHVWVWSVMEPDRLGKEVSSELENPETELWLSPISIWEVLILSRKQQLDLFEEVNGWISRAVRCLPVREAPITHEVARELGKLHLPRRDPADYFLVATAKVFDLTLATSDELLLKNKEINVLRA
jgi:PIN domain nuclease of toxin-antitoxin system